MLVIFRIGLLMPLLWLAACTSTIQVVPAPAVEPVKASLAAEQPGLAWWQLRLKLAWPEDELPDLSTHLLVAEQLILPAIVAHEQQLPLWRVHRRAARDDAGNQFSLIFYADEATAEQIREQVFSDPLTLWLIDQSLIVQTRFQKRTQTELGQLEQTSDPSWPMDIQRSWPYFIMGVSQTWMMLVQEVSREQGLEGDASYSELLTHYQQVDKKLDAQWEEYGQHAYLHHLNAVFGYQPLQIKGSVLRRF
jgi:hypothetical protein